MEKRGAEDAGEEHRSAKKTRAYSMSGSEGKGRSGGGAVLAAQRKIWVCT